MDLIKNTIFLTKTQLFYARFSSLSFIIAVILCILCIFLMKLAFFLQVSCVFIAHFTITLHFIGTLCKSLSENWNIVLFHYSIFEILSKNFMLLTFLQKKRACELTQTLIVFIIFLWN